MADWKHGWKPLVEFIRDFSPSTICLSGFPRFDSAVMEALHLTKWYAQEHVLLCLVPAFFIAGAVVVFIGQASVIKYVGANVAKVLTYGVASVSGTIMAVCSCTIYCPLFTDIYRMGAGLGPAVAFLNFGPAINVLAIIHTARVLGLELGIARAVGAILFSIVIGLFMHLIFRKDEAARDLSAQEGIASTGSLSIWLANRPRWPHGRTIKTPASEN